ncbi:MAG TPA: transposase [Rhizomicrobium sp.]|nr:transposase [Rhizomicrobium sp.]
MDARREQGAEIASIARLTKKGGIWLVPSQTRAGRKYTVCPDKDEPHCSCADHETNGGWCKHMWAVEFHRTHMRNAPPPPPAPTPTPKPTYPQKWSAYNAAQTHEKELFLNLLRDLCDGIVDTRIQTTGRPRLPLGDAVFAACYKVFSTVSGRRFMTDLRDAQQKGLIARTPHFNTISNTLEDDEITATLRDLITQSSLPLKAVECDFAVDSSGFTSSRFVRWFDHKYGAVRQQHTWVKVHLMCGVKTNIVTAVEIRDKDASDTKLMPDLVDATAKNFKLREVSGDKGYGSLSNYAAVSRHGATPYIAFKNIHSGRSGGLWKKMFHLFQFNRDEFLAHYHKRSNVETTFSMIKAKFRDHVRSKTDAAMVNEVLCKIVCHNICCLIQEAHELGISLDTIIRQRVA